MAFLDHIDPGNSGGSVVIPNTPFVINDDPILYPCEFCGSVFKDKDVLSEHRITKNLIKRPLLLINGNSLRREKITIRSATNYV